MLVGQLARLFLPRASLSHRLISKHMMSHLGRLLQEVGDPGGKEGAPLLAAF